MRNIVFGMSAAVVIGAVGLVGYYAVSGVEPLHQISEQWDEDGAAAIPGNGQVNVDEEYGFGATGASGSITLPPVVPCANDSEFGLSCHSGFFFAYQVIMRWKGSQSPVATLGVETVTPVTQGQWTVKQGGEWVTCIDMTFDPPTLGTTPTLTVTGASKVNVVGYLRYRFPQHNQFCFPYQ